MVRSFNFLWVCVALAASLVRADDGWGGWGLGGVMDKINDASSRIKDNGKKAYDWAKIHACAYKVKSDIQTANKTMTDQLNSDCESAASKVSLVHDHALSMCLSVGRGQIDRTLEQQGEKLEKSCLEAVDGAPDNWKSAIEDWASKGKNAVDTSLGSTVQDAMSQAKEKFGETQGKFASIAPIFREGAIRIGSIAAAGAAAMAVVGAAAAVAFRLHRARLASEVSPIMGEESGDAEPEMEP
mmetsp:Transcript_119956/g.299212  ORF Transcript_119956/g.299212 Transcript_119956/m.299212 type:complete len:241 (+) Transcript_119956:97-819(+)